MESASLVRDAGARRQYVRQLRQEAAARAASLPVASRNRLNALAVRIDSFQDPTEAEIQYLREACASDQLNAHCYRLRAHKAEAEPGSVRLYVRAAGLTVAPDSRPPASFPWPSIGKLSFDRKKFEIKAGESRITLYSSGDEKSKLLLTLCKETHQFSMKMALKLTDILKKEEEEEEDKSRFTYDGALNLPYNKDKCEQRISVISSASSNTTSGIVSDRVHSEDELEIMIDSPPVAVVVENCALVRSNVEAGTTTRAVAQGSRCSSSGSTVVAANAETCVTPAASSETSGVYTMTTGSAAVPASDDGSLDYGSFRPGPRAPRRDVSSLRSSSYRTESVSSLGPRDGGIAASECASFYNDESFVSGDSVDGAEPNSSFRVRVDSNASGAESFHGDGTDPTDAQLGPLSAEELSDLIVGRGEYPPPPAPPPPLVHEPQNSESDYVTLPRPNGRSYLPGHEDTAPSEDGYPEDERSYSPPPPIPPKRIDSANRHNASLPNVLEAVEALGNGVSFQSSSALFKPPPPYESEHQTLPDCDLSGSLRELRLGIPVRDPPPYPGRAYPARFLPMVPHVTVLRAHASAVSPTAEPSWAAPAPPPPLTVYTSQLARSQIEQYRRQLYSDVDYVVYPMQDPAISQQDYLDSKIAAMCPRGALCRSRGGGSAQALSDTYVRLPPCAIPPRRDPPPPPFGRTVSDDNILNSLGSAPRSRRLPPPPPPYPRRPPPREPPPPTKPALEPMDIKALREKSKNLDLPLISALCNDKSLLKQTKAFVMPRHGERERGERGKSKRPVSMGGGGVGKGPARRGCHRHPGDALPALPHPAPRATANTYVPDPRSPAIA